MSTPAIPSRSTATLRIPTPNGIRELAGTDSPRLSDLFKSVAADDLTATLESVFADTGLLSMAPAMEAGPLGPYTEAEEKAQAQA